MDPVSLVVAALVAGLVAGLTDTAKAAVKDTYDALKARLQSLRDGLLSMDEIQSQEVLRSKSNLFFFADFLQKS